MGNSGCGKTTLSRMITRVLKPSGGASASRGEDISTPGPEGEQGVPPAGADHLPESGGVPGPSMRIGTVCWRPWPSTGWERAGRSGWRRSRPRWGRWACPTTCSPATPTRSAGGEGQRLVICRALLLEPEVLLLDEPTSMLDVSVQASIMNLLRELQERLGLTYLYITHDIELLGWISHTIGVMQRGRLVEVGSRDQVMEAPCPPLHQELFYSYTHWEQRPYKEKSMRERVPMPDFDRLWAEQVAASASPG